MTDHEFEKFLDELDEKLPKDRHYVWKMLESLKDKPHPQGEIKIVLFRDEGPSKELGEALEGRGVRIDNSPGSLVLRYN